MTNKAKRILFLPAWYPNKNHLSIGSFVRSHAEAISTKVPVDVLHVCGEEGMKGIYRFEKTTEAGVNTYILYYTKPKSKTKIAQLVKAVLYIAGQFYGYHLFRKREDKPAIFHVHVLTRAAILPFVLSFFSKIDYFVTEHWSRYLPQDNTYTGFFRKKVTEWIVKKARGVSAVAENLKIHMNRHNLRNSNFKVISNVVAPKFLTVNEHAVVSPYFVHVSNFANCKNVIGILKAFRLLQDLGHPFHLKIVGDGVDFEKVRKLAVELNLQNTIFTGFLYSEDVVKVMAAAKALVLFSDYENQPVVIIESLTLGIPVIATNVGGIPEMIDAANGLLVAPNDVFALSDAMRRVLTDEVVFERAEIRRKAVAQFSADIVANQFVEFYKDGGVDCCSISANP